ncbi:hypothetical protein CEW83_13410 [Parazoarcus communis]|uniref:DUF3306 domain-containing protein n=1 Tax=Parazoarcus communis TaxID=41977 RepID=A0A2U8GRF6_9RHOO|nr:DUF3306 domain-containing protein [Parazoarcus communis]AWI76094.1 hypothetical protein CEW83_13410 [Parazoarcus communis]
MSTPGRFLSRWSRLKLAPVAETGVEVEQQIPAVAVPPAAAAAVEGGAPAGVDQVAEPAALPDIASLALDSDFTAFLKDEVSEGLRRQALKKLFNDPHFNVMDGLDIYIDDYSVSTPIPPELLAKLRSAAEWLADRDEKEGADAAVESTSQQVAQTPDEPSAGDALLPEAGATEPALTEPSQPCPAAAGGEASPAGGVEAAPIDRAASAGH